MKYATEKQIALIQKLRYLVEYGKSSDINVVDLTKLSIRDASTIIDGLLGLKREDDKIYFGGRLSASVMVYLDKVFDTLDKYKS